MYSFPRRIATVLRMGGRRTAQQSVTMQEKNGQFPIHFRFFPYTITLQFFPVKVPLFPVKLPLFSVHFRFFPYSSVCSRNFKACT